MRPGFVRSLVVGVLIGLPALLLVGGLGAHPVTAGSDATAVAAAVGDYPELQTVAASGTAGYHGSTGPLLLNSRIIDLVATASGTGYWILAEDGGVFSYGDAGFFGSTGDLVLNEAVQGMAATSSGKGYWFVASDGGVFAFGDAGFVGSIPGVLAPGQTLNAPIVGIVATPDGQGYWMVASDGGVFAFGSAFFVGSLGASTIPAPITAFTPTPSGQGYWMIDSAGRTYAFGDAVEVGTASPFPDTGMFRLVEGLQVTDAVSTPTGKGLWVLFDNGFIDSLGDAAENPIAAPELELGPAQLAVGLDVTADGSGMWVASSARVAERGDPGRTTGFELIRTLSDGTGMRWTPCVPITWQFNPAYSPPGGLELISDATRWISDTTGLTFVYGGTTEQDPSTNRTPGLVVIGWQPFIPPGGWAQRGWATTQYGRRSVWGWVELDAFQVAMRPVGWTSGDWGGIALHELLHVVGLGHPEPSDANQLMSNAPRGHVGAGDLAGLTRLDASNGC